MAPAKTKRSRVTRRRKQGNTRPAPPQVSKLKQAPRRWRKQLKGVLITERIIRQRVRALAKEIEADLQGQEVVVIALLNGTILFIADLIRHFQFPMHVDFMGISSYGTGTTSGELKITKEVRLQLKGRHVLLVDDILDTGRTLTTALKLVAAHQPKKISVCVLLDKPERRIMDVAADYTGFRIPDAFVVGYGLDYAERYRNLPYLAVMRPPQEDPSPRANSKT